MHTLQNLLSFGCIYKKRKQGFFGNSSSKLVNGKYKMTSYVSCKKTKKVWTDPKNSGAGQWGTKDSFQHPNSDKLIIKVIVKSMGYC